MLEKAVKKTKCLDDNTSMCEFPMIALQKE